MIARQYTAVRKVSVLSMPLIDPFSFLHILHFVVSFTVYSPAVKDETFLVHNTVLIAYYIQVPNGHIAMLQLQSSPNILNSETHNYHTVDLWHLLSR